MTYGKIPEHFQDLLDIQEAELPIIGNFEIGFGKWQMNYGFKVSAAFQSFEPYILSIWNVKPLITNHNRYFDTRDICHIYKELPCPQVIK